MECYRKISLCLKSALHELEIKEMSLFQAAGADFRADVKPSIEMALLKPSNATQLHFNPIVEFAKENKKIFSMNLSHPSIYIEHVFCVIFACKTTFAACRFILN